MVREKIKKGIKIRKINEKKLIKQVKEWGRR